LLLSEQRAPHLLHLCPSSPSAIARLGRAPHNRQRLHSLHLPVAVLHHSSRAPEVPLTRGPEEVSARVAGGLRDRHRVVVGERAVRPRATLELGDVGLDLRPAGCGLVRMRLRPTQQA
jgi:hypothetical protein